MSGRASTSQSVLPRSILSVKRGVKRKYALSDQKTKGFSSTDEDVKKPRVESYQPPVIRQKRHPILLLSTAKQSLSCAKKMVPNLLREFAVDHLQTLNESEYHSALTLLLRIANKCRMIHSAKTAASMLRTILSRANNHVFSNILNKMFDQKDKKQTFLLRPIFDTHALGIVEMALRRNIILAAALPSRLHWMIQRASASIDVYSRISAIKVNLAIGLQKKKDKAEMVRLQETLCRATSDRDPRVRSMAAEAMLEIADSLHLDAYPTIKKLAADTDYRVRKFALRILQTLSLRFPTSLVAGDREDVPLHDDAFSLICNAVNDMEVGVRAEAVRLLGLFENVSDFLLDQTLDKKLMKMSTNHRGAPVGARTTDSLFSIRKVKKTWKSDSSWGTGKQLNEPGSEYSGRGAVAAPEEESIVPQGACGAFISALEDEFMIVRRAAVYSLGRLASTRPSFAATALDHLADMFNDEIEQIRLDSIKALTPLVSKGKLFKEQLETIIKCLDDASADSRQALRELLCKAEFADVDCVKLCVCALLNCMVRFPVDIPRVYECLAELGGRHSVFVHSMVRGLLDLHPIFHPQEQHIDDIYYVAKLMMVLNGASRCDPIVSLLPDYTIRHFRYMRAAMPKLIPAIPAIDGRERAATDSRLIALKGSGPQLELLEETYTRLVKVQETTDKRGRAILRGHITDDLEAIASLNVSLAGATRLVVRLAQCVSSWETLCASFELTPSVENAIAEATRAIECMEWQFFGISPPVKAFLIDARLHFFLLQTLVDMLRFPVKYVDIAALVRSEFQKCWGMWRQLGISPSSSSERAISFVSEHLDKKVLTTPTLIDIIAHSHLKLPPSFEEISHVQIKWAEISEPDPDSSSTRPHRFVCLLPTSIGLTATLHNLCPPDLDRLRVSIEYPDLSSALFRPRRTDFTQLADGIVRIRTRVLMSVPCPWADPADVRLSFVLLPSLPTTSLHSGGVPIPLLAAPDRVDAASVTFKMHPMARAGGQQVAVAPPRMM